MDENNGGGIVRTGHQSGNVRRPVEREEEGCMTGGQEASQLSSISYAEMDGAEKVPPSDFGWLT